MRFKIDNLTFHRTKPKLKSLEPCINQTEKHQHLAVTFGKFQIKLKCNVSTLRHQFLHQYIQKHCI
jgi:urease accessory protein UreF